MMTDVLGFRIVGSCTNERRLVDWQAAFVGYASLDERAEVDNEAYLSAFTFGDDFRRHFEATRSTKGFDGGCGSQFIWFDIDRADLEAARRDAARLALLLIERYSLEESDLLVFFSGSKGFHVGLPTGIWQPTASKSFNAVARRFCEGLAASAQVVIDLGVFDKVRAFRAPNSRHPKTGLHKRALTLDELTRLSVERIQTLAQEPLAFDLPDALTICDQAMADWREAEQRVISEAESTRERRASCSAKLNRQTLDFIRNGARRGDRHRTLFSAAANLAEFGCPADLAHALLTESSLDAGLSPSETRRQIDCGLHHSATGYSSVNPCDATTNHQLKPTTNGTLFPSDIQGQGYYDR